MKENKQKITIASRKDFDVSYFVGSGKGGQNKQKCHSGVNIIHRESGAVGRNSENRSQEQNKKAAFASLLKDPKWKFWFAKKIYEIEQNETIEETIEKETAPEYLKFEIKNDDGKWVEVPNDYFESEKAKIEYEQN